MITVLLYLVIAALIGVVIFFLAVVVFGRGEQMAPLDARTAPAELPEAGIESGDVTALRFSMALRGYRMSDVDWALARLGQELDSARERNEALRQQLAETDPAHPLVIAVSATPGYRPAAESASEIGPAGSHDPAGPAGALDQAGATSGAADLEPVGSTGPEVSR